MNKIDGRLFFYETNFLGDNPLKLNIGEIYQIAELSLVRGGEIPEHNQFCDEITYAVSGKAKIYSGDECFDLAGGEIHYIKKGIKHRIVADDDENFRYICFGFEADAHNEDVLPFADEVKNKDHFVLKGDGNIRTSFEHLVDEIYTNDSQSNKMISLYMTQILISLCRLIRGRKDRVPANKTASGYAIYHTLRYIDREYINIKSVKSVARELSYSEYYLAHLFKEKVGVSIKEYIIEKKLKNAAILLKTTDLTIGEIAEYHNFATLHTFSQAFKRYFKVSPSEFKKSDSKF